MTPDQQQAVVFALNALQGMIGMGLIDRPEQGTLALNGHTYAVDATLAGVIARHPTNGWVMLTWPAGLPIHD